MSTRALPDVLIVGGGVIGAACAYALTTAGRRVVVLDHAARPGTATPASAGMLAPMLEAGPDDPLGALGVRSRDLYPPLVAALEEETGVRIGLQSRGIYQVRFTEDEARAARHVVAWQRQQGYATQWLTESEVREALPGLGPEVLGAVFAPEDASLDPAGLVTALFAAARARGATVRRNEPATELLIRDGRAVGARTRRAAMRGVRARHVVLAAGCWTGGLRGLPRPLPVEPVRGQMARHRWPHGTPPAVVFGTGGYVVHRAGHALVGATMGRVGFDPAVSAEGLAHVAGVAARVFPALADLRPETTWAGLRPMSPDGHPIVGPDPDVAGLWYATGHGRNGILLAALTAQLIRDGLDGTAASEDFAAMHPARLWTG
jgi:glycine oxidase